MKKINDNTYEVLGHKINFGYFYYDPNDKPNGGMTVGMGDLWVKFQDEWFKPYGNFTKYQIIMILDLCKSEYQVISLMEMLSAKKSEK